MATGGSECHEDLSRLTLEQDLSGARDDCPEGSSRSTVPWQQKLQEAKLFKLAGNERYKDKQYKAAIGKYHRALLYLRGITQSTQQMPFAVRELPKIPHEVLADVSTMSCQCYNNLSACLLQSESPAYSKVIHYCDEILRENPSDVKALYRKGVALYNTHSTDLALEHLQRAARLPAGQKDSNIKKYIQLCEAKLTDEDKLMKDTYKAMFTR